MSSFGETVKYNINKIRAGALKDMLRQTVWIYQYVKSHWKSIILYTALGLVSAGIGFASSFIARDMVDIITGHRTGEVVKTFVMLIAFQVVSTVVGQITSILSNMISMRVDADIKADVFSKILVTDWESLTKYHTGDLLTRWGTDAGTISGGVLNWIPNLIINLVRVVVAFVIMILNDWTFAVFSLVSIPFSLIFSRTLMKRMLERNKESAAMNAKMNGFNQEAFSNIQTIKAFNAIGLYIRHLKQLQRDYISLNLKYQKLNFWTSLLMTTIGLIVSYASYGWGIHRVWSGVITYGTMTMFLSLSGQLTGALNSLVSMVPSAVSLTTSAGRIMDILDMPREDYSREGDIKEFLERNASGGIGIKADGISYAYENEHTVFSGASLSAGPGEVVALVGPSGEGKTTLMRLLLALASPKEGSITLEGAGESMLLSPSARQCFSYVPQGNTMFSGTIAENMRNVKEDAADEEIINALKLADAWDFVEKLKDGINSPIKERGGGFSEGQAQRLSIARALLRRSPILLLDEATSALDVATERRVISNIMKDDYPRTCIVTTHRPSVLTACDRVYRIADMKCEEIGEEEIKAMME